MPIFGQVWLWSSLAFLLGALLCWALVALPARRRVGELEAELSTRFRRQPADQSESRHRARDDEYDKYGRYDDYKDRAPVPSPQDEPLARAYALPRREPADVPRIRSAFDSLSAPPETDTADTELADTSRAETTQYLGIASGAGGIEAPPEVPAQPDRRGWFDDDERSGEREPLEAMSRLRAAEPPDVDGRLVDDDAEAPPAGTVFTQHTHPIPGEVIRRLDESAPAEPRVDEPADALVDDLADEDAASPVAPTLGSDMVATPKEPKTEIRRTPEVTSQPMPGAVSTPTAAADGAQGQTEVMPAARITEAPPEVMPPSGRRSGAEQSRQGTDEPKIMPGVTVRADQGSANPLPKRVPNKPRGHTPFGVETAKPEPLPEGESARALFEPIVPAEDSPVVPPPHRIRGDGNGRGPFGPGSAMPLPGGASPSPEFTIKASVSALRYCTPESPQFGRTVAEVWFKSPADAERVGFRPVG
ncbi:MAG: hypothetical protein ACRDSK_17300 [Actinophytocola sp.]|uniref:sunset domain-containing protein n=1 Tax=Actinophytocola sp. TaxID=1872138 RepID=UPI003D6B1203